MSSLALQCEATKAILVASLFSREALLARGWLWWMWKLGVFGSQRSCSVAPQHWQLPVKFSTSSFPLLLRKKKMLGVMLESRSEAPLCWTCFVFFFFMLYADVEKALHETQYIATCYKYMFLHINIINPNTRPVWLGRVPRTWAKVSMKTNLWRIENKCDPKLIRVMTLSSVPSLQAGFFPTPALRSLSWEEMLALQFSGIYQTSFFSV